MKPHNANRSGFTLVEVALALGIGFFGLVAVIGLVPTAIDTTRSAMDETRSAQMAQRLLAEFHAQKFTAVTLPLYNDTGTFVKSFSTAFDLSALTAASPPGAFTANNNGEIMVVDGGTTYFIDGPTQPADKAARYYIAVRFNNAPAGTDAGDPARKYANQLTIRISWDKNAGANVVSARKFSSADFTGLITRY